MVPGLIFSSEHIPQQSVTEIVKWPLRFIFGYVQPITNEEYYKKGKLVQPQ